MSFSNRTPWDDDEHGRDLRSPGSRRARQPSEPRAGAPTRAPYVSKAPMLLDLEDVCELLHLGRTTVFAAIKAGELARIKINRRTLFDPADVAAFIALKKELTSVPDGRPPGRR